MKRKYLLLKIIIIIVGIILVGITAFIIHIHSLLDFLPMEKKTLNDKYVDYVCRDIHLVSLNQGEEDGYYYVENEMGEYCCVYYLIDGEDANEFILSSTTYNHFGAVGRDLVFQSSENKVDVLNEWNVQSCEVYYYDINEGTNKEANIFTDRRELIQHTIVTISDDRLLQEVCALLADKEEDSNFLKKDENYSSIYPPYKRYYVRIRFEESENIVWETEIRFYRDKEDESKWVITLPNGTPNMFYKDCGYEIQIDFDTELGKVIRDAIGHLEYDEEK